MDWTYRVRGYEGRLRSVCKRDERAEYGTGLQRLSDWCRKDDQWLINETTHTAVTCSITNCLSVFLSVCLSVCLLQLLTSQTLDIMNSWVLTDWPAPATRTTSIFSRYRSLHEKELHTGHLAEATENWLLSIPFRQRQLQFKRNFKAFVLLSNSRIGEF